MMVSAFAKRDPPSSITRATATAVRMRILPFISLNSELSLPGLAGWPPPRRAGRARPADPKTGCRVLPKELAGTLNSGGSEDAGMEGPGGDPLVFLGEARGLRQVSRFVTEEGAVGGGAPGGAAGGRGHAAPPNEAEQDQHRVGRLPVREGRRRLDRLAVVNFGRGGEPTVRLVIPKGPPAHRPGEGG